MLHFVKLWAFLINILDLHTFFMVLKLFQPIASQWYKASGYTKTKGATIPQTWWEKHSSEVYGFVVP